MTYQVVIAIKAFVTGLCFLALHLSKRNTSESIRANLFGIFVSLLCIGALMWCLFFPEPLP